MKNRRTFLMTLTSAFVALVVLAVPVIADELFGVITKVDVAKKTVMVLPKGEEKEIEVKVTDDTLWVTAKGESKIDLDKVEKNVAKRIEAGKKGVNVKITHEKATASKIEAIAKKKAN